MSVGGAATKYILRTDRLTDPQYIVKYAQKHGLMETLTEFFLNQLGQTLGLRMAHSGLILSDSEPTFVTRIFLEEDEILRHGSLIIEDCFKREKALDVQELDKIHPRSEQEFYSIDFVTDVLKEFCGKDFPSVMPLFIEMLVFDALVGSMDRHSQNWGVVAKSSGPVTYRFSPIFDTARALLWSLDERHVERMLGDEARVTNTEEEAYEPRFLKYVEYARPCMGPQRTHPNVNDCNHFQFIENVAALYPEFTYPAIEKITDRAETRAGRLLGQFPFQMGFSGKRKRLILKILRVRGEKLKQISRREELDEKAVALPI